MTEKNDNKDNFEFFKLATNYLSDRFLQPLSASLLLSWAAWNYKIIMILISFDSVDVKFKNIEQVQAADGISLFGFSLSVYWSHGFVLPIISALAFIYLYPFFSTHALRHTLLKQRVVNELKRLNSEEELIDVTRSRELVKENAQLKFSIEKIEQAASEKEKSLTEAINMLESNVIRLNEQLSSGKDSSLHTHSRNGAEKESEGSVDALDYKDNLDDVVDHSTYEKIRGSDFIWGSLDAKVYSLESKIEFTVASLFAPEVWGNYSSGQQKAISIIFFEKFKEGAYINIEILKADDAGLPESYVTLPFQEYTGWKEINDKVISLLNISDGSGISLEEMRKKLNLKFPVLKNCLAYLESKNFMRRASKQQGSKVFEVYIITSIGRYYAEALGS